MSHHPEFTHRYFRQLPGFYSSLKPSPLKGARLLYHSETLADELGLSAELFTPENSSIWCGEKMLPGMKPLAQVYSGHQFGVWAGQLGDGRGILLGEQQLADGRCVDWHLKGAGKTPYSRQGDGRAVLRSVVREFLASEALHALGIPTTRALTISTSDEWIQRETHERGAMLLRIAESHVRFGHFEHFYYGRQPEKVRQLADYVIEHHWPQWHQESDKYFLWFTDVVERTARLIAHWQSVGFAHGVMNTDNMSILGMTIDFGPFGFLDDYDPHFICNHSDYQGRYSFDNQPAVAQWNLHRLAQALSGLIPHEALQVALDRYAPVLMQQYGELMRAKLGFSSAEKTDNDILSGLFRLLHQEKIDYSRAFLMLSETEMQNERSPLRDEFVDRAEFDRWFSIYRRRLQSQSEDDALRGQDMRRVNPKYVLRNYLAQQAIEGAEKDDICALSRLHRAISHPFETLPELDELSAPPPEWGKHIEISCSS